MFESEGVCFIMWHHVAPQLPSTWRVQVEIPFFGGEMSFTMWTELLFYAFYAITPPLLIQVLVLKESILEEILGKLMQFLSGDGEKMY